MDLSAAIADNLSTVRTRIAAAARRAGRDPSSIRLIAVSKTFGADRVRAAAQAGQVEFGENRVQEGLQKMSQTADLTLRWHLIGTLQTNKVRKAAIFSSIHSIDSLRLLEALDEAAASGGRSPEVLVQVDLAGEATKHGAPPADALAILQAAGRCRALRCVGLMTIPPFFEDSEDARPYFAQLAELRGTWLRQGIAPSMLQELSMGMSHDFDVAVQEGATVVRLGTAIFGTRHV